MDDVQPHAHLARIADRSLHGVDLHHARVRGQVGVDRAESCRRRLGVQRLDQHAVFGVDTAEAPRRGHGAEDRVQLRVVSAYTPAQFSSRPAAAGT